MKDKIVRSLEDFGEILRIAGWTVLGFLFLATVFLVLSAWWLVHRKSFDSSMEAFARSIGELDDELYPPHHTGQLTGGKNES